VVVHPSIHRELARQRQQDLLHLRQLAPSDQPALIDAFSRLSRESRYRRYAVAKAELTRVDLDRLTNVDPPRSDAVGAFVGDELVGVAQYAGGDEARGPELGIVVVDGWQRRGVGHALANRMIARARALRHPRLHAHVLVDNRPALQFMRRLGFKSTARDGTFVMQELDLTTR
jgi:RimJ/RimL family protein N-acetyltransferase